MKQKRTQIAWVVPKRAPTPHFLVNDSKWQRAKSHDGAAKKFVGDFSSPNGNGDVGQTMTPPATSDVLMTSDHEEVREERKSDNDPQISEHFDYYKDCVEEHDRDDVEALLEEHDDGEKYVSTTLLPSDTAEEVDHRDSVTQTKDMDCSVSDERVAPPTLPSCTLGPDVIESCSTHHHQVCSDLGLMFQGLMISDTTVERSFVPAAFEDEYRRLWGHFVNKDQVCEHCKQPFSFLEKKVEDYVYVDACKIKGYFHNDCQVARSALKSGRKEMLWNIVRLGALREQRMLQAGKRRTRKIKVRKPHPVSHQDNHVPETNGSSSSMGRTLFKNLRHKKQKEVSTPVRTSPIRRGRKIQNKDRSRSPKRISENVASQDFSTSTRETQSHGNRNRSYSDVAMQPDTSSRTERSRVMLGRFTPISLFERENGLQSGTIRRRSNSKGSLAEETSRYHQLRAYAKGTAAYI